MIIGEHSRDSDLEVTKTSLVNFAIIQHFVCADFLFISF